MAALQIKVRIRQRFHPENTTKCQRKTTFKVFFLAELYGELNNIRDDLNWCRLGRAFSLDGWIVAGVFSFYCAPRHGGVLRRDPTLLLKFSQINAEINTLGSGLYQPKSYFVLANNFSVTCHIRFYVFHARLLAHIVTIWPGVCHAVGHANYQWLSSSVVYHCPPRVFKSRRW